MSKDLLLCNILADITVQLDYIQQIHGREMNTKIIRRLQDNIGKLTEIISKDGL